jgi:hypothetical protein
MGNANSHNDDNDVLSDDEVEIEVEVGIKLNFP